jgi:PIN domain nuclease of toxin-antitoxin system
MLNNNKIIDTSLRQWYNVTDTLYNVGLDAETQWEIGIKVRQKKIK